MIKAAGRMNGQPLLVLGLSAENCRELLAGRPVKPFGIGDLGLPPMWVQIVGAWSEDAVAEEVARRFPLTQEAREAIGL